MGKVVSGVFNNKNIKYCSKCGKPSSHHYELNRGYGSQFDNCDGHIASFDLCDYCHKEWIDEAVNESPIIEDYGVIYPSENQLLEFIDTFPPYSQDMVYYGYDTSELKSAYEHVKGYDTYTTDNKETIDYEKLYLDFFESEKGVKEAFEESSYITLYGEDGLSNE